MSGLTDSTEFGWLRGIASPELEEDLHAEIYPHEVECNLGLRIHYDTSKLPYDFQEWANVHIQSDYDFTVIHFGPQELAGKTLVILWCSNADDAMLAKLRWL